MPRVSEVFADVRGEDRTMRISLHRSRTGHRDTVVVSLWLGPLCRGSFRMAPEDLDRMMATLAEMRSAWSSAAPGAADHASGPAAAAQGFAGTASVAPVDGSAPARGTAVVVPLIEPAVGRPAGEPVPGFGFGLPPAKAALDEAEPFDEEPGEVTGTVIAGLAPSAPTGRVA